jgi:filamentous hemagglutinin
MSVAEFMNSIKGTPNERGEIIGATYPGELRNDSSLFAFAANKDRTVIQAPVLVTEGQFDYLRTWYTSNLDTPLSVQYGFPGRGVSVPGWNECVFNCATFPSYLGLPIPEYGGQLRNYIPALEKMPGVKPWQKPEK